MRENQARPGGELSAPTNDLRMPEELQQRLRPWIDVSEVGREGFFSWLGTIVPLLPPVSRSEAPPAYRARSTEDRVRGLARELVDCARERARLTVASSQYFRDNQALSLRVHALEAAIETARHAGSAPEAPADAAADAATERYLPARRKG